MPASRAGLSKGFDACSGQGSGGSLAGQTFLACLVLGVSRGAASAGNVLPVPLLFASPLQKSPFAPENLSPLCWWLSRGREGKAGDGGCFAPGVFRPGRWFQGGEPLAGLAAPRSALLRCHRPCWRLRSPLGCAEVRLSPAPPGFLPHCSV